MADILIRGMEMPVQCVSCPMWSLEGVGNGKYVDWCRAAKMIVDPYKRPTNCPLISLPEGHGRLVDADALEIVMDDKYTLGDCGRRDRDDVVDALRHNAPTIVPAEKEDT